MNHAEAIKNTEYLIAFGPEAAQDIHGDEYPVWNLFWCDSDDIELYSLSYSSREKVIRIGEKEAKRLSGTGYSVEFINEAGFP